MKSEIYIVYSENLAFYQVDLLSFAFTYKAELHLHVVMKLSEHSQL